MLSEKEIKNILIVNTRSSEKKLAGFVMWGAWAVASFYKKSITGSDVVFLDENNEDDFLQKFKNIVPGRDLVGFSLTSMQIKYSLPLMKYIRENYSHIKISIGGIHPTLFPNQDYGGLVDEAVAKDLPKNYFDYDLLPKKVREIYHKRAQVLTGFNCSFKCAFCVNSVRNCQYEGVPIENIKTDLDYVMREFNPKKIYFRDEDFFQDFEKARQIVDYILEKKYDFVWDTNSRVTSFVKGKIDDQFLKKIKKSGCLQLRFGVESGSQKVLNYLRKGQTLEQIKFAVKQCVKYGIEANCSLLIGVPGETAQDREATYQLIEELSDYGDKVSILGPQLFRLYPGGLIYEEAKKYGVTFPEKFVDWATYYDKGNNPIGHVFDTKINYPWLSETEKRTLPYVFALVHYGLNYRKKKSLLKKIIGSWFYWHWKKRWFDSFDIRLFMYIRKKIFNLDEE